jgi:hypothetical protein
VPRNASNSDYLCAIRTRADSLNFVRASIAQEPGLLRQQFINPHDLLSLLFSASDPLDDAPQFGPAGIPTPEFGNWIQQLLGDFRNDPATFQIPRRELLHINNLSFHQMEAILDLLRSRGCWNTWVPNDPQLLKRSALKSAVYSTVPGTFYSQKCWKEDVKSDFLGG